MLLGLWFGPAVYAEAQDAVPAVDEAVRAEPAVAMAPVAETPELFRQRTRPLAELGADLAAADIAVRLRAFDALRSLSASRVADVEARLRHLRLTADPAPAAAFNTLAEVRHHLGLEGADEPADLAFGVRQLLESPRAPSTTVLQVAERMALLRGLEHMDSLLADRVMVGFFQRGWSVWQWEARHLVGRRGLRMLPSLIEGRSAGNPDVRRWAVGSVRRLGVDSVGAAVQMVSVAELPDVLRAYASLSDLNAMPAVISFVDHPDDAVRAASREATARYERNAIWQLRLAYRNKLGENADLAWSWETTMRRLFDALDARRLAPANELLAEGLEAAERGEWELMRERYERALRREPLLPRRSEMSAGYAAEATQRLDVLAGRDDAPAVDAALTLLRRATRLAPEHPDAGSWRATVAFHEAERARQRGALDEGAYAAVLAARPDHPGALAVVADIEDGGVGEVEASGRQLAARILFLLGLLCMLPYRRLAAVTRVAYERVANAVRPIRSLIGVRAAALRWPPARSPATTDAGVGSDSPPALESAPAPVAAAESPAVSAAAQPLEPLYRVARRFAFFGRSLVRTLLPRQAASTAGRMKTLARQRQQVARWFAKLPSKVSWLGRVAAWLRRQRIEWALPKAQGRRPSLAEVRSTLSMLASSEPPKLTPAWEPGTGQLRSAQPPSPTAVVAGTALDTAGLVSRDDEELAEALFGHSEPGPDAAEEDARPRVIPPPARDMVSTLTQLAHDTSPGFLEAPDTLPS